MALPRNPWGEYQRQNPASAANIVSAILQTLCVVVVVGFAYYALKYKPFQQLPISTAPAHPITRHNRADERLLSHVRIVAPLASAPSFPAHISLTAVHPKKRIPTSNRHNRT